MDFPSFIIGGLFMLTASTGIKLCAKWLRGLQCQTALNFEKSQRGTQLLGTVPHPYWPKGLGTHGDLDGHLKRVQP